MKNIAYLIIILISLTVVSSSHSYTPSSYELMKKVLDQFDFKKPVLIEQDILQQIEKPAAIQETQDTEVTEEDTEENEAEEEMAEEAEAGESESEEEVTEEEDTEENEEEEEVIKEAEAGESESEESEKEEVKETEEETIEEAADGSKPVITKRLFSTTSAVIKYPFSLHVKVVSRTSAKEAAEGKDIRDNAMEYVIKDNNIVELFNDDIISFNRNMVLFFYEFFSFDNIQDLLKYLEIIKIDSTKVTMGIYDHKVCYVLGSDQVNDHNNQLWIEKETNLPLLLQIYYKDEAGDFSTKYEFSGYDLRGKIFFPGRIKFYKDDKLDLEYITRDMNSTKIEDKDIFNVNKIIKDHANIKTLNEDTREITPTE